MKKRNYYSAEYAKEATINNCYSDCSMSVNAEEINAFIYPGNTVTSCYYNSDITYASDTLATPKTTAEMILQATFTSWDFAAILENVQYNRWLPGTAMAVR